jgi:predicted anti-sigma-YlaC factor YlaD
MTCTERERDLALLAGGELRDAELEQHVAECSHCREYLAGMSVLLADLASDAVPATPPIAAAVMRRIRIRRYRLTGLGAAAAAGLLVAMLLSALMRPVATLSVRAPAAPAVSAQPVVAESKPAPARHRRSPAPKPAESVVVKLATDDPNVVIYWITD